MRRLLIKSSSVSANARPMLKALGLVTKINVHISDYDLPGAAIKLVELLFLGHLAISSDATIRDVNAHERLGVTMSSLMVD